MIRSVLAVGLLGALAAPAWAQSDQVQLIYPPDGAPRTTVIQRTTVTDVIQTTDRGYGDPRVGDPSMGQPPDTLGSPPLQADEIQGAGPPPRHPTPHHPYDPNRAMDPNAPADDDGGTITSEQAWQDPSGTTVELRTHGVPRRDYGPTPSFQSLDQNGDGIIDESEASAYPLLANDFLYASGQTSRITPSRYRWWTTQAH